MLDNNNNNSNNNRGGTREEEKEGINAEGITRNRGMTYAGLSAPIFSQIDGLEVYGRIPSAAMIIDAFRALASVFMLTVEIYHFLRNGSSQ